MNEDGYSFNKQYRLLARSEFLALAQSKSQLSFPGFLLIWSDTSHTLPRLGITASRKAGPSVVRNRAKRLIRECFRLHRHNLPPVDIHIIVRRRMAAMLASDVNRDLLKAFQRIG